VFAEWWNTKKEEERRVSRRHVKEIFDSYDKDGGGSLDKDEMARMVSKASRSRSHSSAFLRAYPALPPLSQTRPLSQTASRAAGLRVRECIRSGPACACSKQRD
jgi:hypothetical protein